MIASPDSTPRIRPTRPCLAVAALAAVALAGCPAYGTIQTCPADLPGPADQAKILAHLDRLPDVPAIMAAVEDLERCGALDVMDDYITRNAPGDVRLRLGVMLVQHIGRGSVSTSAMELLLHKARDLPESDLQAYLAWCAGKLVTNPDTEAVMAFVDGTVGDSDLAAIAAAAPIHVPAGPWAIPGDQAPALYVGREVHKAIGEYYREMHKGELVRTNTTSIASIVSELAIGGVGPGGNRGATAVGMLALEPDITNLTTREIYEIKPAGAAALAAIKLELYLTAFASADVTMQPGRPTAPGTIGILPAPAGHVLFYPPAPGIILYQYRRGEYVTAAATAAASATASHAADASERISLWDYAERMTGLTGTALVLYLFFSESTRLFPPRNAIPIP